MYCDNTGAIDIAKESGITKGARHYRAKVHYLREVIEFGDVNIEKVHTDDNLVDPFTKALSCPQHLELTKNIGLIPATASTTLVANKEFVPPLDMCRKIPWALSRINQIIAWLCPQGKASVARRFQCQYKCSMLLQHPSGSCWIMTSHIRARLIAGISSGNGTAVGLSDSRFITFHASSTFLEIYSQASSSDAPLSLE
ncbi:hypothetical protein Tco_1370681 [Tanacetum coccineum]